MVAVGATAVSSHAATLYQTYSFDLVLTYQASATTNSKDGEISDTEIKRTMSTSQFLQLVALDLGVTLNKGASLVRVTSLAIGTNYSDIVTNETSAIAGDTTITNVVIPTTVVWQNNTNPALFMTNSGPEAPATNFTIPYSATNFTNFVIQGKAATVAYGSNVQFFIYNASDNFKNTNFNDTSVWIPLYQTNANGDTITRVNMDTTDDPYNFQNDDVEYPLPLDDQNTLTIGNTNYYFGDNYYEPEGVILDGASLVTNLYFNDNNSGAGPVFVGTIKTNLQITGTLYGDNFYMTVGNPFQAAGKTNYIANLNLSGNGDATATTGNVGTGKAAKPFTSWNGTFDVTGSGNLGGLDTNMVNGTNFVYSSVSNGLSYEQPGFYNYVLGVSTSPTNPPAVFTNNFVFESNPNAPDGQFRNYYSANPPATYTDVTQSNTVTADFTVSDTGTVTNIYTNVFTNVLTLVGTNYDTNYSVTMVTNSVFVLSGTVKQTTVKISSNP